jgi:hypothetical protein
MNDAAPELDQVVSEPDRDEHILFRLKGTVGFQKETPLTHVAGSAHAAAQMLAVISQNHKFHQIEGAFSVPLAPLPVVHPALLLWFS